MQYDALFKSLFGSSRGCLIPTLTGSRAVEQLSVEFNAVERRVPDLVTRLEDGRILHLEVQTVNDADMPLRMLQYWILLSRRFPGKKIEQLLLYAGHAKLSMPAVLKTESLQYGYALADFRTMDAKVLLASPLPAERMLAILCRTRNIRKTIRDVLSSWQQAAPKERANLLLGLMIISGLRKLRSAVKEEVKHMAFDIEQLVAEHERASREEWRAEGLQEGLQAGLQRGLQTGLQRGLQAGEAAVLRRQLRRRFGPLPADIEARIDQAAIAQLDEWAVRILDAKTLAEVFA